MFDIASAVFVHPSADACSYLSPYGTCTIVFHYTYCTFMRLSDNGERSEYSSMTTFYDCEPQVIYLILVVKYQFKSFP